MRYYNEPLSFSNMGKPCDFLEYREDLKKGVCKEEGGGKCNYQGKKVKKENDRHS